MMKTLCHQFNIPYKDIELKPTQLFMFYPGQKCQLNPFSIHKLNFHPPPKPQTWANHCAVLIFLFKKLTVLLEANFASHKNMLQGVVTHSDSHVPPVTCSSDHYDGIVFPVLLTPVAVSISSFKILGR